MKMKSFSKKKLITSLVSIVIIAGMAIQSFATNVDMAAFVQKDKYMTKFYELDYRIKNIKAELERLYKLTCTNIVSYGGAYYNESNSGTIFQRINYTQTRNWYNSPTADLYDNKYLRVNHMDQLQRFGSHPKLDTFVKEIPASLCKWRTGIELKPETTIKIKATRNVNSGTGTSWTNAWTYEVIMGPFKKFPFITQTGESGKIMATDQFFNIYSTNFTAYYDYNKETAPTSWSSSLGGNVYFGNATNSVWTNDCTYPVDVENHGYKYDKGSFCARMYVNSAMTTDISSRTNVWIRLYGSGTSELGALNTTDYTLTSWNYGK